MRVNLLGRAAVRRCAVTALFLPGAAVAANGLYITGYGMESVMMGGADVAVSRDAFAANNNPAGMTQLPGKAMDLLAVPWLCPECMHSDVYGNYRKPKANRWGFYGSGAYAQRIEGTPYAAGVALVVQGGQGWTYSGLNTVFGNRDDASALFGVVKLSPAVAWQVNDRLSLGTGLGVNYLSGNQELFPNTSVAPGPGLPQGFAGFRFKDASGIGLNYKIGMQYRFSEDVTLGATYGTQTSIPMKNGTLRINLPGIGVVRYDNAKLTGIRMPEELAIGISFRPTASLLVSLQDKWYNWSHAINRLELRADNPRVATAPPVIVMPSVADFMDQHVLEAGIAYDYDMQTVVMAGVNFGRKPLHPQNVSPVFAVMSTMHYMGGIVHRIDAQWQAGAGVEIYTPQRETYDSPLFGPGANEISSAIIFHLSLSRRW